MVGIGLARFRQLADGDEIDTNTIRVQQWEKGISCPPIGWHEDSKRWSARQLAGELRHSPVHRDASHDGSFSILVHSALFQVEQHLEFFDFHNAYILSVQI